MPAVLLQHHLHRVRLVYVAQSHSAVHPAACLVELGPRFCLCIAISSFCQCRRNDWCPQKGRTWPVSSPQSSWVCPYPTLQWCSGLVQRSDLDAFRGRLRFLLQWHIPERSQQYVRFFSQNHFHVDDCRTPPHRRSRRSRRTPPHWRSRRSRQGRGHTLGRPRCAWCSDQQRCQPHWDNPQSQLGSNLLHSSVLKPKEVQLQSQFHQVTQRSLLFLHQRWGCGLEKLGAAPQFL